MIPAVVAGEIRETLLDYLRTTWSLSDRRVEGALFRFLTGERGIFQGPYLRLRLPFEPAPQGAVVPLDLAVGYAPYRHQLEAWKRLSTRDGHEAQPTLVVTGTGSGKTEAFLMPILDHCLRARQRGERGIKAIVLYPMNALATDQARRIAETIWESRGEGGMHGRLDVGMYVGGKGSHRMMGPDHVIDVDEQLRLEPPDILLTNYKMLDFLLLRPKDARLWARNGPETLRYVVLDELHTYDGAQGTDVACLIRRLDARLGGRGTFCPVGTSATVTGEGGRDDARLLEFASRIFGREFPADAVIGETRRTPASFFELFAHPLPGGLPEETSVLVPRPEDGIEAYVGRVARAWFPEASRLGGEGEEVPRAVLGDLVVRYPTARALIEVASERLWTLDGLAGALAERDAAFAVRSEEDRRRLLDAMLAMLSWSLHEQAPGMVRPLVSVQVQLWVREVRRLVREVAGEPRFAWRDEEPDRGAKGPLALPIYACRSCGHSGWISVRSEVDGRLERDYARIGRAAMQRDPDVVYLHDDRHAAPEGELPGMREHVCTRCARIGREERCRHCKGEGLPVWVHQARSAQAPPKDLQRCPACGTDFALGILASRAATLSSVAVGHLYTTPFNSDRKLLAFSDSVQDASHRAGFFAGRTYRFTLRSAMLAVVPKDGTPVPLASIAPAMIERFGPPASKEQGEMIAAFMPRDLEYLEAYQSYMDAIEKAAEKDGKPPAAPKRLLDDLGRRLRWEVTRELGLAARIGRTLERTGCASVGVDGEVLDRALADLPERMRARFGVLDGVEREAWRRFVAGLVHRMRLRGGVFDELLKKYFEREGHGKFLTKREVPLLSPFGPRTSRPLFVTDAPDSDRFDTVQPSRDNWYVDWARRALGVPLALRDAKDLYRALLPELVSAGLMRVAERSKRKRAWALEPGALVVSRRVTRLECGECGAEHVEVAGDRSSLLGGPCLRYRCAGTLAAVPEDAEEARARGYYRRFYEKPTLGRVWASEHTGLLERSYRETLEARFKDRRRPDAPNMLSCTPTLEMGIDIGDLSSTMLVSVPPTAASYLQRIGRAGRKTGNALVLQITTTRPHDLYFFDDPEAVMAGPVQPPGCYLDAPEILKRHALAWCLDAWAKEAEGNDRLPVNVRELFTGDAKRRFPGTFFRFMAQRRDALRAGFVRAFPESTGDELSRFFEGVGEGGSPMEQKLQRLVELLGRERDELRRHHRYLSDRIKALEAEPHKVDDYDEEHRELTAERRVIDRELHAFHNKYLLELLCERGLLPNYAFPEDGVKLRAFVVGDDRSQPERFEWVRAAQTAIRELAPFNTFYGMARKVRIDNVDVGGRRAQDGIIEPWQLCSQCGHMERFRSSGMGASCPRCGADDWQDQGRRRAMVRLQNVFAYAHQREAAFSDESEDRDRESYVSEVWLDPDPADARHAWLNMEAKFGFELLSSLTVREVNFGRDRFGVPQQTIGGRPVPDVSFEVCGECGQVREEDPERRRRMRRKPHRPWCTARHKPEDRQPWRPIHLYRELESEALRLILPVSMLDPEVQLPNARAALELGMRRYFGGDPDHLRVTLHDEPTFLAEGARRRYLVVHDTVPGGTGVLAELAVQRGAGLRRVLEEAREAIATCPCRERGPEVRACYRCLYAYRRQDDLAVLDRDVAGKLVERWLAAFDGLKQQKGSISVLEMASILESELEHRFVARLRDWAERTDGVSMVEDAPERWRLTVGGRRWRMEPQVLLDEGHDVAVPCRPDFVLWPEGHDGLPVAVFADGASYHVKPGAPRGRIGDDFAKRQAVWRSGRFRVWSFAWQDLDVFSGGAADDVPPWMEREDVRHDAERVAQQAAGEAALEAVRLGAGGDPVRSLVGYLRDPDARRWQVAAVVLGVALLARQGRSGDPGDVERLVSSLRNDEEMGALLAEVADGSERWAAVPIGGWPGARLLVHAEANALRQAFDRPGVVRGLLRLDDIQARRGQPGFAVCWRAFLRATCLLQFLPGFEVVTTEQLLAPVDVEDAVRDAAPPRVAMVADSAARTLDDDVLEEIRSLEPPAVREVVERLVREGAPVPDIPLEHGAGAGLDTQVLLGWPAERVAVYVADEEAADAERLSEQGWTVFAADATIDYAALRRALGLGD